MLGECDMGGISCKPLKNKVAPKMKEGGDEDRSGVANSNSSTGKGHRNGNCRPITDDCFPSITTLSQAKEEIRRLREELDALSCDEHRQHTPSPNGNSTNAITPPKKKIEGGRAAVMARAPAEQDYVKTTIPKPKSVRDIINKAIQSNTLFRACSEEELVDLVDAFKSAEFPKAATVIRQGDEGEDFYVVEKGSLEIFVNVDSCSGKELKVGVPYLPGSAFGELALMYGSARAATIRATQDCKLWSIGRTAFRAITSQHKLKRTQMHLQFLRDVKIGDNVLGEVLSPEDINAMALATQKDSFAKGDVIVREGERGDIFYLIESGTVEVYKKGEKEEQPVASLSSGNFFGEKALLSEDVRRATCIASSDVKCLYLMREDFDLMLGSLQDLLDGKRGGVARRDNSRSDDIVASVLGGKVGNASTGNKNATTNTKGEMAAVAAKGNGNQTTVKYDLADLETKQTLGVGAFGRVKLVQATDAMGKKRSYALKCLAKTSIVENGLQDHVLNEKLIMEELDHPFILTFHCAIQNTRHIYFLLEVLEGGELFKFLRAENQFPEAWSRFYAASVVLAFCEIHARKIAYRDLKPENLVMDSDGYLKLVDFGLAKKVGAHGGKLWTLCGTPDYLAPEVILNEGHDWAVDYWALGVLVYEMTAGIPPFYADDPMEIYEKILSGHVAIPSHFSRGMADLVKKLLRTYQSKRLGRTKGGCAGIMKHRFFSGMDWAALTKRDMDVPIKPSSDLNRNFDFFPEQSEDVVGESLWTPIL